MNGRGPLLQGLTMLYGAVLYFDPTTEARLRALWQPLADEGIRGAVGPRRQELDRGLESV